MEFSGKETVIDTVTALLEEFSVGVGRITPGTARLPAQW